MADPNLIYDPPTGHEDTTVFPTNPAKETVRGLMQRLHNQTRDFINNILITWINTTFATKTENNAKANSADVYTKTQVDTNQATKAEVQSIVLGQIIDGSITPAKLSFDPATQIELDSHLADNVQSFNTVNINIDILRLAKTATGLVNAFAVDTAGTFDLTINGNILTFIPNLTTTTTTPTIAVDGQTAKNIKKADDTGTLGNLVAGDIKKNIPTTLVWDSVNDFFILAPKGGGSIIKSTQRGVANIPSSQSTIDITITPVNINNTKVTRSFETTNGIQPSDVCVAIELINATTIRLRRNSSAAFATSNIAWEVIEYLNVKSKQTGIKTLVNTSDSAAVISSIDTSKSELIFSFTHNDVTTSVDAMATLGRISDSTNLVFKNAQLAPTIYWQVIEFN